MMRATVPMLLLTACGDDLAAPANLPVDVPPVTSGAWWRPALTTTWQWQLQGTVNTGYAIDAYDVDLFDSPGNLIASLQAAGRRVICYFSAGSSENWRPDFGQIDPLAMGDPLDGWDGERWLDIRAQTVVDMVLRRLDLAVYKGCDGVEPDNVDGFTNTTGFDLTAENQLAFNRFLGNAAHQRDLAVALKNDIDQIAGLAAYFDLELNEECHVYDECGTLAPFTAASKPIFNAEYAADLGAAQGLAATLCPTALAEQMRTLILPIDLDDAFRVGCD